MIYATITNKEKDILMKLIGKTFTSYECEDYGETSCIYGNLRIYAEDYSVEIINEEDSFDFFDTKEDVTHFKIKTVNPNVKFKPEVIKETKIFPVNNIIKSIEIIKDEINVNHGEYEITFDMAIIFKFENSILMFSKDLWFLKDITISKNDNLDLIIPINEVIESFSNEGEYDVVVKRKREILG